MSVDKKITIGLTVFIGSANTSIWSNGAIQNFIFLYVLLNKIDFVKEVILINGGDSDVPSESLMLGDIPIRLARLCDVIDEIDVLIEGGSQLYGNEVAGFRARGGKVVNYQIGNSFIMDKETTLFGRAPARVFDGAVIDEVWTLPHHAHTCKSYWQIMHRTAVHVLPYIWSPMFVDKTIATIPDGVPFGYQAGRAQKKISIFEPNVNVVKTYHYPVLVCEMAYRKDPSRIKAVYVTNTDHIETSVIFQNFMCNTDIGKNGIATIEKRFPIAPFLAMHTDVVVAHQWENQLNNLYFDVLYGGYPLVHNSEMLGAGYYYPSFDANAGADVLLDVLAHHDEHLESYQAAAKACVARVSIDNVDNVRAYADALRRVCQMD